MEWKQRKISSKVGTGCVSKGRTCVYGGQNKINTDKQLSWHLQNSSNKQVVWSDRGSKDGVKLGWILKGEREKRKMNDLLSLP